MNYRDRLIILASLLVLPLTGITMNAFAESEEAPSETCNKEADEAGLSGTEREEFIKECVQSLMESTGK